MLLVVSYERRMHSWARWGHVSSRIDGHSLSQIAVGTFPALCFTSCCRWTQMLSQRAEFIRRSASADICGCHTHNSGSFPILQYSHFIWPDSTSSSTSVDDCPFALFVWLLSARPWWQNSVLCVSEMSFYYAPAPSVWALSDDARLTSVCRVHWA